MGKEDKASFVKVAKAGEVIEINPMTLDAHKRHGWVEFKDEKGTKEVPFDLSKLSPEQMKHVADAVKELNAGGKEEQKATAKK